MIFDSVSKLCFHTCCVIILLDTMRLLFRIKYSKSAYSLVVSSISLFQRNATWLTVSKTRSAQVSFVAFDASTVSALRRVGWMLDRFTDLDVSGLRELTTASAPTMLDPHGGRRGPIDTDWGLILNASVEPEA